MAAMAARKQVEIDEIRPFDLELPYEPVPAVLRAPRTAEKVFPLPNQLYEGDAVDVMKQWEPKTFHACITDPPYNIARDRKGLTWAFSSHVTIDSEWDRFTHEEYEAFTAGWLEEVRRVVKENGNVFIFGSYHNIYTIGAIAARMDMRIVNSIVWAKPNAQPNITCRMFTESTEQILWLCNNSQKKAKNWTFNYDEMKALNGGKQMRNFWEIPVTPQRERVHGKHPSQKPLRLMERIVLAGTNRADRVLDCFAGSGSTLLACDRLDRRWVGVERDGEYAAIAHRRLDDERRQRRLALK
jgi:site-specific DNA-methyltransferase (adenine-specific)